MPITITAASTPNHLEDFVRAKGTMTKECCVSHEDVGCGEVHAHR
jgi:hypothetical protein